ncbi:DegT/DnrJ/EryC1/StrS aminotransferase family protein [Candidatus Thorarchaeota archaeon]|nr:MAG: DegT/DnrJ/EryC1/StrS aminotransferase family protein [Candidatus Thorarchaeota archaeon]
MIDLIPFAKPIIDHEELEAVEKVLKSGMLAEGKVSRAFEEEFQKYLGTKYATVTSNGTTALSTALEAMNIQPGDEVITTPFTFIASANTISMIGAIPIFVDVDPDTYNIDPEQIREAITEKTTAIMPVHIFGMPCDMKHIMDIAEDEDLMVIEDACQAHGGTIDGHKVGTFGDVSAFSFYATKNMMTGEGGMIATNNEEILEKALMIKNHGRGKGGGYSHFRIGYNNRMMDLVAALGRVQLSRLPENTRARRVKAIKYNEFFEEVDGIETQREPNGFESSYHVYAPRVTSHDKDRDEIIENLREMDVGSRTVYALPCHKQGTYLNINEWRWAEFVNYPDYKSIKLPISEEIGRTHFDIPVHPLVSDEDMHKILNALENILT